MTPRTAPTAWPPRHLALAGEPMLQLASGSCLAVRAGAGACRACEAACPADTLVVDADGPRLAGNCLHCGRCAAACPSGALRYDGFKITQLPSAGRTVVVECAKAPPRESEDAIRVPCFGGIAPAQALQCWLAFGSRPLTFVNRGWCEGCRVGGDGFAADALIDSVNAWLADCGVPSSQWLFTRSAPARGCSPPIDVPAPASAPPTLSRRGFFRRVSTEIGRPAPTACPPAGPRAALRAQPCELPARESFIAALESIAGANGRTLPGRALPSLSVTSACDDTGLCAGMCPTGALQRSDDGVSTLTFDAVRCIGCGRCEAACPGGALSLGDGGGRGRTTLRRTALRECIECGARFPDGPTGGAQCPRCAAGASLARALFGSGGGGEPRCNDPV